MLKHLFHKLKMRLLFGPEQFPATRRVHILPQMWRDFNLSHADTRMEFLTVLYSMEDTGREQLGYRIMAYLQAATHQAAVHPAPQKFFLVFGETLEIAISGLVTTSFRRQIDEAEQNRPEERHPQQNPHGGPQVHIFLCYPPEGEVIEPTPPQDDYYTAIEKCGSLHIFVPEQFDYYFKRFGHRPIVPHYPSDYKPDYQEVLR